MSLRFAHELGFALAMSLALLSVLLGGELPTELWGAMAAPWLAMLLRRHDLAASTPLGTVMALAAFVWGGLIAIEQGLDASLVAAAIALVGILVARLMTRRTPSHDLQALVLSLLLVFAGTVLHQQFTYGLVFVFYAVTVTWALVTRQLVEGAALEGWRRGDASFDQALARRDVVTPTFFAVTAGVAVVILLATSLLFVLFPRVGLGGLGLQGRNSGRLPTSVSLLGVPRAVQGGSQVVARLRGVSYRTFLQGLYLRGSIYDHLDAAGFSQSNTLGTLRPTRLALAPTREQARYEVYLQPVTDQVLLSLGPVVEAQVQSGGYANPSARARLIGVGPTGELLSMSPLTGPMRYSIFGGLAAPRATMVAEVLTPAPAVLDAALAAHFLALPDKVDPRIAPLAQQLAGSLPTLAGRAEALRKYLLTGFTYSLDQPNAGTADPLAAFLFDDRRGHCEYFATAFAVLLRAVGVPSRVVGGYQGGTWDAKGEVVVFTGANAHAWVEWYAPGVGWFVDDATPAADGATLSGMGALLERLRRVWDDEVVDYGLDQQLELLNGMVGSFQHASALSTDRLNWRPLAGGLGALLALVFGWYVSRHSEARPRARLAPFTRSLVAALERLAGAPLPPPLTLREAVQRLSASLPPSQVATLQAALAIYEARRFAPGGAVAPSSAAAADRQLMQALRRLRGVGAAPTIGAW